MRGECRDARALKAEELQTISKEESLTSERVKLGVAFFLQSASGGRKSRESRVDQG